MCNGRTFFSFGQGEIHKSGKPNHTTSTTKKAKQIDNCKQHNQNRRNIEQLENFGYSSIMEIIAWA